MLSAGKSGIDEEAKGLRAPSTWRRTVAFSEYKLRGEVLRKYKMYPLELLNG